MTADAAPFRDQPLSEAPLEVLQAELARLRAMPPGERMAAGRFISDAEERAYSCGGIAATRRALATAPRWVGSQPRELWSYVEEFVYVHFVYPSRRLWRRVTGRTEYDD